MLHEIGTYDTHTRTAQVATSSRYVASLMVLRYRSQSEFVQERDRNGLRTKGCCRKHWARARETGGGGNTGYEVGSEQQRLVQGSLPAMWSGILALWNRMI